MTMTDPISDMLARIRNASMARLERTEMPLSTLKLRVAEILKAEGYISGFSSAKNENGTGTLTVVLRYGRDRASAIVGLRRTSRPGRRVYLGHDRLPRVHNGMGVAVISTSSGVMTDKEARAKKVGGEVLFEVW